MKVELAHGIQDSGYKFFVSIAGGGQSFIGEFCKIAGASKALVGALVPYHPTLTDNFLGYSPDHYVSEEVARKLALSSYKECLKVGVPYNMAMGVGVTSSIATENEREGRVHKMFLAIHTSRQTTVTRYALQQGRTRLEEETFFCEVIECAISSFCSRVVCVSAFELRKDESYYIYSKPRPPLFTFKLPPDNEPLVIYPGSWNPMHDAHKQIYHEATQILGREPILELCLTNTDKGIIDNIDVHDRILTMEGRPYTVTDTPTFKEKIERLRAMLSLNQLIFVVGADTWNRIWDPKYAGPTYILESAWERQNVKFLVFGRRGMRIDEGHEHLRIDSQRAADFDMSMSSTEIRRQQNKI